MTSGTLSPEWLPDNSYRAINGCGGGLQKIDRAVELKQLDEII